MNEYKWSKFVKVFLEVEYYTNERCHLTDIQTHKMRIPSMNNVSYKYVEDYLFKSFCLFAYVCLVVHRLFVLFILRCFQVAEPNM